MNKHAFSFIEVTLTLGILSLIVGISVISYRDYSMSSKESTTIQNLDTIRRTLEISEATSRIPCKSGFVTDLFQLKFAGNSRDPWGNIYYVDNKVHKIYSFGPDGIDDHGNGDDIYVEYHGIRDGSTSDPPLNARASGVSGSIIITWDKPARPEGITGYIIEKRSDGTSDWKVITEQPLPADETLSWEDRSEEDSIVYYRVIAVYDDSRTSKPSELTGWLPVNK